MITIENEIVYSFGGWNFEYLKYFCLSTFFIFKILSRSHLMLLCYRLLHRFYCSYAYIFFEFENYLLL